MLTLLVLILVPVVGALALPFVVKHQLTQWLDARGVSSEVSGAQVNLLSWQVALESLQLGDAQAPALRVEALEADVDRAALLNGELRFAALAVRGVRVDWRALARLLEHLPVHDGNRGGGAWQASGSSLVPSDGLALHDVTLSALSERIGQQVYLDSISLQPALDERGHREPAAAEQPTPVAPVAASAAPANEGFVLALLGRIGNGTIRFDGNLDLTADAAAGTWGAEPATAAPGTPGNGVTDELLPALALSGRFNLSDVALAGFEALLQDGVDNNLDRDLGVQGLAGRAQGAGLLDARIRLATGGARIALEGRLSVDGLRSGSAAVALGDGAADFHGRFLAERAGANQPFEVSANGRVGVEKLAWDLGRFDRPVEVAITEGAFEGAWRLRREGVTPQHELSGGLAANAVDVSIASGTSAGERDAFGLAIRDMRGELELPPQTPQETAGQDSASQETASDGTSAAEPTRYRLPWLRAGSMGVSGLGAGTLESPLVFEGVQIEALAGAETSLRVDAVAAARVAVEPADAAAMARAGPDATRPDAEVAADEPWNGSANGAWAREAQLSWTEIGSSSERPALVVAAAGASLLRLDVGGRRVYLNEPQAQSAVWSASATARFARLDARRLAVRDGSRAPAGEVALEHPAMTEVELGQGGRLTAVGVSVELAERRGVPDDLWSLRGADATAVAIGPGSTLQLEHVSADEGRLRRAGVTASGAGLEID
ncbi:MAG: hypothetical protein ACR2RL_06305, partial [Gammaproteobacteria bacterium]